MSDRCNVLRASDGFDFRVVTSDKTCNLPSAGVGIWRSKTSMTSVNPCSKHLAILMEYPFDGMRYSWFQLISADSAEPTRVSLPAAPAQARPDDRKCNCGKPESQHTGKHKMCPSHGYTFSAAPVEQADGPTCKWCRLPIRLEGYTTEDGPRSSVWIHKGGYGPQCPTTAEPDQGGAA